MVIKFICPNGHQLSAPDDRAGKPGKCPKCQTAFVVPDLEELDEAEQGKISMQAGDSSPSGSSSTRPASADVIVFLCPNGHKLNGPASLKGRPGQCPHCGARFVIPGDEDEEEPAAADATAGIAPGSPPAEILATGSAPSGAHLIGLATRGDQPLEPPASLADEVEEVPIVEVVEDDLLEGAHPLAVLLHHLCPAATEACPLELQFKDGKTLAAEGFVRRMSLGDYAVFVHPDGGTQQAVTIVAWDDISRLTVRRQTAENWLD
ncbi:MAG: hypothetical protein J5I93_12840 [Pirellulaceae bacterium]|nr:hypothetical protein [Pirellulaceae bacterium]